MKFKLKRVIAFLIDLVLSLAIGLALMGVALVALALAFDIQTNINMTEHGRIIMSIAFALGFTLINFYPFKQHQTSVGKKILGLKVQGSSNVMILLLRTIVPVLLTSHSFWLAIPVVVIYLAGFGAANNCIHDYVLQTRVVSA